jgi:hypothetical protein
VAIPYESDTKPSGLAFLLFAIAHLQPTTFWDGKPDDRRALEALVSCAVAHASRLVVHKPTPEYEDLFAKLSNRDMEALKKRFGSLATALRQAAEEVDPVEACRILQGVFGDDFPIPKSEETGKKTSAPAIITSSSSA